MNVISKKIVTDEQGRPLEVVIAWDDYKDLAERMGWDLEEEEASGLRESLAEWRGGNRSAFVPLAELK